MKKAVLVSVLIFTLFALVSCNKNQVQSKTYYTFFDTVISVYSYTGESGRSFEKTCKEIESQLDKYNRLYDIYHEYSGVNNLCTVNKNPGVEISVDSAIVELLDYAKNIYVLTNGEVNVMMGSVLNLWKETVPSDSALHDASLHCNIDNMVLDKEHNTVTITDPLSSVDVGAIAKGYAVEKIANYLSSQGKTGYIINAGGNVKLIGSKPDGSDFKIAIQNPNKEESAYAEVLCLQDTSCVTSGMYQRENHIIDKDTLCPPTFFDSVSIVTKDSAYADALSTALFCMNYEDGLKLANSRGDFEALWITTDGTKLYTEGMKNYIYEE